MSSVSFLCWFGIDPFLDTIYYSPGKECHIRTVYPGVQPSVFGVLMLLSRKYRWHQDQPAEPLQLLIREES